MTTWLVTGGAGFIGGNFVLRAVADGIKVVNLDALTYAGNRDTLASLEGDPNHVFVHGDIGDRALVAKLLAEHRPDAVVNFAAESHVDRSIDGPAAFIQTNVVGTLALLAFGVMDVNDLAFNEKLQGNEKALQTLQDLFPTEKNWINEWY